MNAIGRLREQFNRELLELYIMSSFTLNTSLFNTDLKKESNKQGISFVVPVFNEQNSLPSVISDIRKKMKNEIYEIIVVDDGSFDESGQVAELLEAKVIYNKKYMGYGESLKKGIKNSKYDIIISVDGDGQYDVANLDYLIFPIKNKSADLVIGSRFHKQSVIKHGALRFFEKFSNYFMSLMFQIMFNINIKDTQSGYRAYNKMIFNTIKLESTDFSIFTETIIKMKLHDYKIIEVPIVYHTRKSGLYSKIKNIQDGIKILGIIFMSGLKR